MAKPTADGEELDVRELQGKQDKIRDLMRRDPRFIGRLIVVRAGTAGAHRGPQQQLTASSAVFSLGGHQHVCDAAYMQALHDADNDTCAYC
jgi:hypothetical protein